MILFVNFKSLVFFINIKITETNAAVSDDSFINEVSHL